jgi:hypothetical protein
MQNKTKSGLSPDEVQAYKQRLNDSAKCARDAALKNRGSMKELFSGITDDRTIGDDLESELATLDNLLVAKTATPTARFEPAGSVNTEGCESGFLPLNTSEQYTRPAGWGAFSLVETIAGKHPVAKIPTASPAATSGVDAKNSRQRPRHKKLSTTGQAGLLANFQSMHEEGVVAISELHPDLDHEQIAQLETKISFIIQVARSYKGKDTGKLADWSKHVPAEVKQFFRLLWLARQPHALAVTIRLDHHTATKALAAKRGPANHLADIIRRTLAKMGITTALAFNLEYTHGTSRENHPLHLHGIMCIPVDRIDEARLALRSALAEDYRQRFDNLAVHIEAIKNHRWWAGYCTKEPDITADALKKSRGRNTVPDYACASTRDGGKTLYESVNELFSDES